MKRLCKIPVFLFVLSGCSNYIIIEQSEKFATSEKFSETIICVDPDARVYTRSGETDVKKSEKLELFLLNEISSSIEKNQLNIDVRVLDEESTGAYYNKLLGLKNDLILANNYQDTPLNFGRRPPENSIQKKVFVYPPLISHDFSGFSQEFGTPYFSFLGVYQKNGKTMLYHLIVNTETSETIYRELKSYESSKAHKKIVAQMVFDSFAMLKKELK